MGNRKREGTSEEWCLMAIREAAERASVSEKIIDRELATLHQEQHRPS